jgi:hypothetical protein
MAKLPKPPAASDERDGWCQQSKNRLVILDGAVIQHSSIGTVVAITASSWVFQRQWQDPADNGHSFREQRAQQTA